MQRPGLATLLLGCIAGFPLAAGAAFYELGVSGPAAAIQGDLVTMDYRTDLRAG